MINICITGKLHPDAITAFERNPKYQIVYRPDCTREELLTLVPKAQVLVTRSETDVDKAVIDAGTELKVVARAAVGVGNIDLEYATQRGILVLNTPGLNTNSAAELTLGLMLGMFRNIPQAHGKVKSGGWDRHRYNGNELRGKTIGIIGLGNVGHRVAKFCRGFDMNVLAYDPYIGNEVFVRNDAKRVNDLTDLLRQVDLVTLHVPLNKETKGMITRRHLETMKPGSYLVNAARGGVVAEADLLWALQNKILAGIAIDTFEKEPNPWTQLVEHEKVWCSPHIGASTTEAQLAIGMAIVEQVGKALEGGVVDYPVNLPELAIIDEPILKSYAVLAEKIGVMIGQMRPFNPERFEIRVRGDLAQRDTSLVRLSVLKGYASQVVDGYVSFVNIAKHIESMGIRVTEEKDAAFDAYKSALKVTIHGPNQEKFSFGGVVFEDRYQRITLINDFLFEVEPAKYMLVIENRDRPGVVGNVGQFLAAKGINISSFSLSRNVQGGKAMAIVCCDSELSTQSVDELKKIENILAARAISL